MWAEAILWAHKVLTLREGRCCRRDGAGPLPEEEDLHPWLYLWPGRNHREWINSHVVYSLSCVRPFATLWTVVDQAPPSTGFPRQEYWSGLPFPSPGDLPHPGIEPRSPGSPMLVSEFFTTVPPVVNFSATKKIKEQITAALQLAWVSKPWYCMKEPRYQRLDAVISTRTPF